MVGAWGNEDLIEKAFELREYDPASEIEIGPIRIAFQSVPHFTETFAMSISSANGSGRIVYGADSSPTDALAEFARDADLMLVEATLPRPERTGMRGHLTPGRPAATRAGRARSAWCSCTSRTSSTPARPATRPPRPSAAPSRWRARAPPSTSELAAHYGTTSIRFRAGGAIGAPVSDGAMYFSSASVSTSPPSRSVPARRIGKLSPPSARNELTVTR